MEHIDREFKTAVIKAWTNNLCSSVHRMLIKMMFAKNNSINQANSVTRRLKTAPQFTMNLLNNLLFKLVPHFHSRVNEMKKFHKQNGIEETYTRL
jgi:hypothetical protein